jgi:hypothetical protein
MYNTIKLIIIIGVFAFHIYSWIYYYKKTDKEKRENDGWNSFYLTGSFLLTKVILEEFNL